jgi:uncharacterized protein YjbI with pentapeptide repeats
VSGALAAAREFACAAEPLITHLPAIIAALAIPWEADPDARSAPTAWEDGSGPSASSPDTPAPPHCSNSPPNCPPLSSPACSASTSTLPSATRGRRRLDDLRRLRQSPHETANVVIKTFFGRSRRAVRNRQAASPLAARARRRATVTNIRLIVLISLAAFSIAIFLVLLLGPLAQWATVGARGLARKEKSDAINTTRQVLLAAAGGTAVLIGLGFTARTYYLSRRGQFTDRYTKAISQLASDKLTERLGGIYALEHLMRESAADHSTIVDVLAAFIRESHPIDPARADPSTLAAQEPEPKPHTDVQAALTVLARRPKRAEPDSLDLSRTDLRGADLRWARFEGVMLERAWLHYANLSSANLKDAMLRGAHLQHSWLVYAQLEDADLIDAQLEEANLGGAQLRNADLRKAQLRRAHLRNANLNSALLAGACLEDAYLVDAHLQHTHLAGMTISGRVNIQSRGYHVEEKQQDEHLEGANLKGANLARAQMQGANLATSTWTGEPAPVRGLTTEQLAEADLDESTMLPDAAPGSSSENPPS